MDDKGFDDYRIELGAKISADTDKNINKFIKKLNKIPENRELRLRINSKNTLSKALNKDLKAWNAFEKKATSGINLFKGKKQLYDIKSFYSKMRKTALNEMQKLYAELSALTDKNSSDPRNINMLSEALEQQRHELEQNKKVQLEYEQAINDTKKQLQDLGKIRQPNTVRTELTKVQSRLDKKRNKQNTDNVLGDAESKRNRNTAMTEAHSKFYNAARDAAIYRNRNFGQEGFKYFKELKQWTDWSAQSETLKNLDKQAKDVEGKFNLASAAYDKLLKEQMEKGKGTDSILDEDIQHAENQLDSLKNELSGLQKQKYSVKLEIDIRKSNKKEYDKFFAGSRDPNFMKQFARAKTPERDDFNVKLKQLESSYSSGIKKSTEGFMSPIDDEALRKSITRDEEQIQRLQDELSKLNSTEFKKQVEDLQKKLEETEKSYKDISNDIKSGEANEQKLNIALFKTNELITDIKNKYNILQEDMEQNPQNAIMMSESLKKVQDELDNTKRKMNVFSRLGFRVFRRIGTNIISQIASIMNPLTNLRRGWDAWINRFENKDWANTFEVIRYNLVTLIAPILEKIAKIILKIAAVANVFTKKFAGIDLFDKTAWQAEKLKKNVDAVTSSLDELHSVSANPNENNTVFDTGRINEEDLLSKDTESALEKAADVVKTGWNKVTGFVKEHPFITAGLVGAWLTKGLWGPTALGLVGKGIKGLFGGGAAEEGAKTGGSLLGNIFGKELYTGMNGKTVTVGKLLGGIALTAGGTAVAISQAADAGKNWQDFDTKTKAAKVGLVGLGSAAAGVGAVMLGATGPVGWAVAGGVALTSLAVGMAQTQDGIGSVEKEQEKLAETQEEARIANDNYLIANDNLNQSLFNLKSLEEQTGLSGEELATQVDNGTLSVQNMTSAQLAVYDAYVKSKRAEDELTEATKKKKEADAKNEEQSIRTEIALSKESGKYDDLKEHIKQAWEDGTISTEKARDLMERAMGHMDDATRKTFMENMPNEITDGLDPTHYESGWKKFKRGFVDNMGKVVDAIKTVFATLGDGIKGIFNGIFNSIKDKWDDSTLSKIKNWATGNGWKSNKELGGSSGGAGAVRSYDVGTNYVPNDQLAMVHKGEAIIPAKYNKGYQPSDNGLSSVLSTLSSEIAALKAQMERGIDVKGEFKQRGNDLVAVVEKNKSRSGNSPLNNQAYAR